MYWTDVVNQILIYAILAMSLNLLLGYMGQVSIAHAAFGAVGGYTSGYLALNTGVPLGVSLIVGIAAAFLLGAVVSIPALLLSSESVILLTLAVQTIVLVSITSIAQLGGLYGLTGLPPIHVLGTDLLRPSDWFGPLLVVAAAVWVLMWWIGESPFGRVLRGIREDQLATQALGKDVFIKKVVVFGVASAIAALGGALLAFYNGTVSPGLYGFGQSILIVLMVVLGGRGNVLGSVLGAGVVMGAQPFFEKVIQLDPDKAALVRLLAFGVLILVVLAVRPEGLLPEGATPAALIRRFLRSRGDSTRVVISAEALADEVAAARDVTLTQEERPIVEVRDVRKAFGGIVAVDKLSFQLLEGRVTGLIGPNGAGKTTVFNLLTGALPPDEGSVSLRGEEITGWPIDRVARHGMVRSFQSVRLFAHLSVLDNVRMAVPDQRGERLRDLFLTPWRVIQDQRRCVHRARDALAFVSLLERQNVKAGRLPYGEQKLVALARILASEAEVLLLDEPASGVDAASLERMIDIIRRLRDRGLTVCVVEHNLHVVERLADHIYFMENGRISAEGTMQSLVTDRRLVGAYFGQP